MNAPTFQQGQPVEFQSLTSQQVFRGRIVERICETYYLVRDQTGRPPRPVRANRLRLAVGIAREGEAA